MEDRLAKYYNAIVEHYKIPDSEYTAKEFDYYTLLEINNELFVVMTEEQIDDAYKDYIIYTIDSIYLPYEYMHLDSYINKEAYAEDCWENSDECGFIDDLIPDIDTFEFRFTCIKTLDENPFYDDFSD